VVLKVVSIIIDVVAVFLTQKAVLETILLNAVPLDMNHQNPVHTVVPEMPVFNRSVRVAINAKTIQDINVAMVLGLH
jgi:hypothetical protein